MEYQNSINEIKQIINSGELENLLGYHFYNKEFLINALTHKSYIYYFKESYNRSNERLEFLGDSVLGLVISEFLIKKLPDEPEGKLTKLKSVIVSEHTLYHVAQSLKLEQYIFLGKSEFSSETHNKKSIIADAVESIIGAIFLDNGLESAKKFILRHFKNIIDDTIKNGVVFDYKSILQEQTQKKYKTKPTYQIIKEEGPEHKKIFHVQAVIKGEVFGYGKGKNKKEAEQNAAKETLEILQKTTS